MIISTQPALAFTNLHTDPTWGKLPEKQSGLSKRQINGLMGRFSSGSQITILPQTGCGMTLRSSRGCSGGMCG